MFDNYCAYIFWYDILQKRLVGDCKTIGTRTQRRDASCIRSVQLGHTYRATTQCILAGKRVSLYVSSIRFRISGRRKNKKSSVSDCCWDFICVDKRQ